MGSEVKYRIGRRCPWNIYTVNSDSLDRDNDDRYAVVFDPSDGPKLVDTLNKYAKIASVVAEIWEVAPISKKSDRDKTPDEIRKEAEEELEKIRQEKENNRDSRR